MTNLSRRHMVFATTAGLAAVVASSIPAPKVLETQADPNAPITPAEYLSLMEANGWRPVTWSVRGEPRGVFEYTVNEWTWEDGTFLRSVNRRAGRSGPDFYKRAARYLFEQGRIDRVML